MNKALREQVIEMLRRDEDLPPDYVHVLFPNAKKECELVYGCKMREEEIIAQTMAVPLQRDRLFGNNGKGWHNKLVFGDNLQVMKSLLGMKKRGTLCSADGTPGIRLVYIDPPFATKQELIGGNGGRAYRDKKVYIGTVSGLRSSGGAKWITLSTMFSGFRDKDTHELEITTAYRDLLEKQEGATVIPEVTISIDKSVTAQPFDLDIYSRFQDSA